MWPCPLVLEDQYDPVQTVMDVVVLHVLRACFTWDHHGVKVVRHHTELIVLCKSVETEAPSGASKSPPHREGNKMQNWQEHRSF